MNSSSNLDIEMACDGRRQAIKEEMPPKAAIVRSILIISFVIGASSVRAQDLLALGKYVRGGPLALVIDEVGKTIHGTGHVKAYGKEPALDHTLTGEWDSAKSAYVCDVERTNLEGWSQPFAWDIENYQSDNFCLDGE